MAILQYLCGRVCDCLWSLFSFWETSNGWSRLLNAPLHSFYFQTIFFLLPQPPYLNSAMQQYFYFGRRITEVQNEKSHHGAIRIPLSLMSVPVLFNCFSVVFCTNQAAGWVMLSLAERSLQAPAGLMHDYFISTLWSVLFFIVLLLTGHTAIVPASAEKEDALFLGYLLPLKTKRKCTYMYNISPWWLWKQQDFSVCADSYTSFARNNKSTELTQPGDQPGLQSL